NRGIAAGLSFHQAFDETGGDLAALRARFRRKAYLGRMSALIEALREALWSDEWIVTAKIADLSAVVGGGPGLGKPMERFLELRSFFGGSCEPDDVAMCTPEGDRIAPERLASYLRDIRMTRRGVEANGEMCRILLNERFRAAPPRRAE